MKKTINNRYEIGREIGAGGMGTVYLANDLLYDGIYLNTGS